MDTILAGDIGGTNTRLALFPARDPRKPLLLKVYASGDYESLERILALFLQTVREQLPRARVVRTGWGIAGPVDGKIVKMTNLPWIVDHGHIRAILKTSPVSFMNDFTAVCHAIPHLRPADVKQVGGGIAQAGHPIAVLGAGTGLGEGMIVPAASGAIVVPSEGGHTDFAPRNPLEIELLTYLMEKFGRVSYERILSGPGLLNLYEFFRDRQRMPESAALSEAFRHEAAAPVITRHGLAASDPICERALDLFCSVYGAEAGNLALQVLARGGVYLAGGIAAEILPRIDGGGFRYAFESKGRYETFLASVPTWVITHPQPGLMGAAQAAAAESA